ncbi:hypothetical protein CHGG_03933 [Chaetomium globosum CBS 148.51]|uniref:HTH APSES-type domain-containing protein n=1 Tax=Chaetomium globosum (strain ATCC 6205 / CBS 148.51 / DSM 1962 / NBRC 6347 / NRRL 1970) TaxID=306901 RepID=Q2H2R3_CHAGB|nr:uncharacterized protein CHGG_03933 [Chaetomium globosum CBS 148.51]EAQ87314.1 hypothetical protein CHGG_03933 [Chaetomium globosum CBS 148.51]
MVSVADLLNPEPPQAPLPTFRPPPVSPAQRIVAFRSQPTSVRSSIETLRMIEDTQDTPRCKTGAAMNFPPFEVLDEHSLREIRRFQVHPFGSIQETGERIPYNSVFHYDFKLPDGDGETSYTVMWDYNTAPAKMLNLNPGLKDITYSITGGSIKAQGYWMPYSCAKAVCATFCHEIAGALIPLFGPNFPFECIPKKSHGYGRMSISPEIVERARNDAIALFKPAAALPSPRPSRSVSPLPSRRSTRTTEPYDYHSDYDRRPLPSPYTDTDVDCHRMSERHGHRVLAMAPPCISEPRPPMDSAAVPTPQSSPAWTAVNRPPPQTSTIYHDRGISHLHEELLNLNVTATANPWLSAVPRSPILGAASNTSNWQSHQPRSHYPNHYQHTRDTPPPLASTSLLEQGITLAPLRLKRRYSKVDGVPDTHHDPQPHHHHHHHNNDPHLIHNDYNLGTTSEDDGEYEIDYDASPSHVSSATTSASASPQSVAAPPPTPNPTHIPSNQWAEKEMAPPLPLHSLGTPPNQDHGHWHRHVLPARASAALPTTRRKGRGAVASAPASAAAAAAAAAERHAIGGGIAALMLMQMHMHMPSQGAVDEENRGNLVGGVDVDEEGVGGGRGAGAVSARSSKLGSDTCCCPSR